MKYALAGAGYMGCLLLMVGCGAEAGSASDPGAGTGDVPVKVPQPNTEHYDYAPAGAQQVAAAKAEPSALSAKGSVNLKYGFTFMKQVSIPNHGSVGCYTAGGSAGVDPVLVLFRRSDNQFQNTPYTEHAFLQTLALNDDTTGVHPYISFTNNSGTTLNTYLMAFAYGGSTGTADLWCTGSPMQTIPVAAGSYHTYAASGTAKTSGSNGDPWLFLFDQAPLSYLSDWNDDASSSTLESSFAYSGSNRLVWFVANGFNTGTTTVSF